MELFVGNVGLFSSAQTQVFSDVAGQVFHFFSAQLDTALLEVFNNHGSCVGTLLGSKQDTSSCTNSSTADKGK